MSVPLTSSKDINKKCVVSSDKTQPHVSEACRETGRAHRCTRCVYCSTSEPKQCFGNKIAECLLNIELLRGRPSGWLFDKWINRQKGMMDQEQPRLTYWPGADS